MLLLLDKLGVFISKGFSAEYFCPCISGPRFSSSSRFLLLVGALDKLYGKSRARQVSLMRHGTDERLDLPDVQSS